MDSFINMMDNVVYTPKQLSKRMEKLDNKKFSKRAEEKMTRVSLGALQAAPRSPRAGEAEEIGAFTAFMAEQEVYSTMVHAENNLKFRTIQYEKATARLAQYVLLVGVTEVLAVPATYDEFGEDLTPEVLYVAPIEALPEFVEVTTYDTDGVPTTETVRNPLVVQDEEERATAQSIIDTATQDVLDLAVLRESVS